jgi:hypothetical protein
MHVFILNGLKKWEALSPFFSSFALEYTIMKVQENGGFRIE